MSLATYTTVDEGKGLVRTTWQEVRECIKAANPEFCALVDEVNPGKEFAFYVAHYPYGATIGDDKTTFIPTSDDDFVPLNQSNKLNRDVINDLGYGAHSAPLSMILSKTMELFIDRKEDNLTLPYRMLHAGDFFSNRHVFNDEESNNIFYGTAGCRSAMLLPSIGCSQHFNNIRREFGKRIRKPDNLYQQGQLLSQLAQHPTAGSDWKMKVLFFSYEFIQKLKHDPTWHKILLYFYHYVVRAYFDKMHVESFMSLTLTEAQRKRNLKVDPYLADTVHHLYKISAGLAPGFVPASGELYLPREFLQRVFVELYGLPHYYPTILHPCNFNLYDSAAQAVYYSRQYPTTFAASPKTRKASSITYEMSEQQYLLDELGAGLAMLTPNLSNALCQTIAHNVEFFTYHSHHNSEENVELSGRLPCFDARFSEAGSALKLTDRYMSDEGAFMRGCVAIRLKQVK